MGEGVTDLDGVTLGVAVLEGVTDADALVAEGVLDGELVGVRDGVSTYAHALLQLEYGPAIKVGGDPLAAVLTICITVFVEI